MFSSFAWPCGCMQKHPDDEDQTQLEHRPNDNRLYQQNMKPCCVLVITTQKVVTLFVLTGLLCLPIGITLLVQSTEIFQHDVDYTDCHVDAGKVGTGVGGEPCTEKKFENLPCVCSYEVTIPDTVKGELKLLYGMRNYYQNHRLYRQSQSFEQILGNLDADCYSNYCEGYESTEDADGNKIPYYPRGAMANSFFTDSFELTKFDSNTPVELITTDISWATDRETKFIVPDGFNATSTAFSWPKDWLKWINSPEKFKELPKKINNEHLINWMNPAAFPSFTKLYAKVNLEGGQKYTLNINYRYMVHEFGGRKFIRLAETSWMGGRSRFLGIAYCLVGACCLAAAVFFAVISRKTRTKRHERRKKIDEQLVAYKANTQSSV